MPEDDIKYLPSEGSIVGTVQRILDGEDPTDKGQYEQQQTSKTLSNSKILWCDVLDLAIDDYKINILSTDTPGKNVFSEVFDWFFNEYSNRVYIGSLENICLNLDINVSVVRKKLILWTQDIYKKKQLATISQEKITEQVIGTTIYVNKSDIV